MNFEKKGGRKKNIREKDWKFLEKKKKERGNIEENYQKEVKNGQMREIKEREDESSRRMCNININMHITWQRND